MSFTTERSGCAELTVHFEPNEGAVERFIVLVRRVAVKPVGGGGDEIWTSRTAAWTEIDGSDTSVTFHEISAGSYVAELFEMTGQNQYRSLTHGITIDRPGPHGETIVSRNDHSLEIDAQVSPDSEWVGASLADSEPTMIRLRHLGSESVPPYTTLLPWSPGKGPFRSWGCARVAISSEGTQQRSASADRSHSFHSAATSMPPST